MERLNGIIIFVLGVAILWQGRGLSVGTLRQPGPGFFPAVIAGILIILSGTIFFAKKAAAEKASFAGFGRVAIVFVALIGYFLFLDYLGFALVSFLLMVFFFLFLGKQRWYAGILWGAVATCLAYLLFETALQSNLPKGIFGF
jgi:hypothetical protein